MSTSKTLRRAATLAACTVLGFGVATTSWAKPGPSKPTTTPSSRPTAAENVAAEVTKPTDATKPAEAKKSTEADEALVVPAVPAPPPPAAPSASTPAAELMKKLKADREKATKTAQVAYFDLSDRMAERPADFSIFGDFRLNLRSFLDRLDKVKADANVKGVMITLGDPGLSLSQAQEVRDALAAVVKSGKPVFVHADTYDTTLYTLATGASDICLLEGGELMMPGVGIESMFLKGLFDKVGVKADYVQIGEYKGADEEYTRDRASDELRGEMRKLVDGLYAEIVDGIATSRKLDRNLVQQSIDDTMVTGKTAKARGLVDHLIDQDGLRAVMGKKLGAEVKLDPTYGMTPPTNRIDFSSPSSLMASLTRKSEDPEASSGKPAVAVIYAEGVIMDGEADEGLFGGGGGVVASEDMRKAFRLALRDDNVKAVVIRIDSPGGSALASEVMWQAARRVAEKKPVIISIGGMAASGGYYLASAGETIYADPTAVVGSIGVVGGKFVLKGLFEKLGVNTETFAKGRNAGLFTSNEPFTDRQRVLVTTWMKGTYDQFTDRIMTTRKGKIKDIDAVARGRIFVARQAKDLGMVDEIGGIKQAIAAAATKGGLKDGGYRVMQVPAPKTLGDYLSGNAGGGGFQTAFPFEPKVEVKLETLLAPLGPDVARQLAKQVQLGQLLQKRPVVLMSPYSVTVK